MPAPRNGSEDAGRAPHEWEARTRLPAPASLTRRTGRGQPAQAQPLRPSSAAPAAQAQAAQAQAAQAQAAQAQAAGADSQVQTSAGADSQVQTSAGADSQRRRGGRAAAAPGWLAAGGKLITG